jgi:hypothetical protein
MVSFRIGDDGPRSDPSTQPPRDLPGNEKRQRNYHDLPQDHAALQVFEQFRQQTSDFGLGFHLFS